MNNVRRGVQIYSILITRNSALLSRITRIIFLFGKLSQDKQVHYTERKIKTRSRQSPSIAFISLDYLKHSFHICSLN